MYHCSTNCFHVRNFWVSLNFLAFITSVLEGLNDSSIAVSLVIISLILQCPSCFDIKWFQWNIKGLWYFLKIFVLWIFVKLVNINRNVDDFRILQNLWRRAFLKPSYLSTQYKARPIISHLDSYLLGKFWIWLCTFHTSSN